MQEKVQDVDAGALITALTGQNGLRGRMNAELDVQAQGADTQALLETLQGEVRADLSEAVLEGINLSQLVRQAAAAIEGQPLPQSDAANETRLVDLQLVSYVHNGVAQVERLLASTDLLMLTGEGQINLLQQTLALDLRAEVALTEKQGLPKELRRLQGKPFPMKLTGKWNAPQVEVDLEQALKAVVQEKLQEKLEREIQEKFGGAGLFDLLGGQGGFLGAPVEEGPRPVRPVAPNLPNAPQAPSNAPAAEPATEPVAKASPPAPEKTDAQKLEEQLQRGLEDALRGLFR
jgi:AsmA protein